MSEDDEDLTPGPEDPPQIDEPEPEDPASTESPPGAAGTGPALDEPPGPINWNLLSSEQAELQWLELNAWVNWLRQTYGLPVSVIPPMWHRHSELVWELSALHTHWLCAYDPEQNGSAPIGWHRDFAEARQRLRDWVQASGTRLDRDRPTRQTAWPGEDPADAVEEAPIENRDEDFVEFVLDDVARRKAKEDEFYASLNPQTGEVT
ncbi:hypothetical protein [Nesterenkonia alkaliphila]|uniref:DUF4913 domain-containing protein n=1 Tax=Nesterenkonia alkaliphila TaxID=1463631 RepID=A0A7K1ULR3_9MICC|nr:hypothetical protein [Nesterenkonia alkaliphila]MVT27427.1 hypothetical protein [Nesterenkonia alkaliphila]GFZ89895.1 hypothetical protein GCM10011359_18990 [Nesterenkonia alkaliphila]